MTPPPSTNAFSKVEKKNVMLSLAVECLFRGNSVLKDDPFEIYNQSFPPTRKC